MTKIINYIGYVGIHNFGQNLGDEALYLSIKQFFSRYKLVPCHGDVYSRITLVGGGTLLPLWRTITTRFNYLFGTGVRDPSFHGQYDSTIIKKLKNLNFRLLGVRDIFSKEILAEWGFDAEVIGDPCLSLGKDIIEKKRSTNHIAIAPAFVYPLWGNNNNRVFEEILKSMRFMKKEGYNLVLLPFNANDLPYISKLSSICKIKIFEKWFDVNAILRFISSCKLLIGERLHSIVFSAAVYTPFISIAYQPKCYHFAQTLG